MRGVGVGGWEGEAPKSGGLAVFLKGGIEEEGGWGHIFLIRLISDICQGRRRLLINLGKHAYLWR